MAEEGEDKLIAAVRHIAKTLGRTDTMTDDILQIFSTFDGRFSREKLSDAHPDGGAGDELRNHRHQNRTNNHLPFSIRSLERQISRFVSSDLPIWSDSADAAAFLDAVDELLSAVRELDPADKPLFEQADDLLQQAMVRLEDEFRTILDHPEGQVDPVPFDDSDSDSDEHSDGGNSPSPIPVAHPVLDYNVVIDAIPAGAAADLREIASRMAAAGYGRECAHAYSLSRQAFIDESVARLGIRQRSGEEIQATPWEDLEGDVPRWVRAVSVAFRILFPSERRLCDRIFAGLAPVADLAFAEACRGAAVQLLGFADAVAVGSRAPERLFRAVDMYEAVRDLVPELDPLFVDQYSSFLLSETAAIWKGLGAAIRGIFMELENLIRRDPAKATVPGGGLHPITRYVMNYLRAACASRRTLEEVMEEDVSVSAAAAADHERASSSLAVQIAWIMEVLQGNLDAKSKSYNDQSLSCVFLMNNGRYIVHKTRDGDLGPLLGDDWVRRQMARVKRWSSDYQRGTWGKVMAVLRPDPAAPPMGAKAMRERLRMFNGYFEEICRAQAGWVVSDEQARDELRSASAGLVIPAYRSFLGRLRAVSEAGRQDKHVKYSAEDVDDMINGMFEGNSGRR